MKTHLFNSLEVTILSMTRAGGKRAQDLFINYLRELSMTIQPIHKPKQLCNMKLVGGDEEDFKAILTLVRETLQETI